MDPIIHPPFLSTDIVERTLSWLTKRRSLRIRWFKKVNTWQALVQFACAHILMDMAIYG